jgi:quinol monooxygenase YgiN
MDIVLGWIRLRPGKRAKFWSAVPDYVAATRAMPGCLTCELNPSREDPDVAVVHFVYETAEAHAALMNSPHEAALLALLDEVAIEGRFDNLTSANRRTDILTFPLGRPGL